MTLRNAIDEMRNLIEEIEESGQTSPHLIFLLRAKLGKIDYQATGRTTEVEE